MSEDNVIRVDFSRKTASPNDSPPKIGDSKAKNQEKMDKFTCAIKEGAVSVVFQGSAQDISIPNYLRSQSTVSFKFSYDFGLKDFEFNNDGISASLQFKEGYHFCSVSWDSIFAMRNESTGEEFFWV